MNSPLGLQPGTVIGRDFEVVQHLASGAMGSVYVVNQRSTGKQRALKLMSTELAGNDRARERFVLEARVGGKVDSDHVVEVVTAGIDEQTGAPYMVMELLRGEELADMMYRVGSLDLASVAEIYKQAGHALEKAHAQGIVHRDLKPENMFIAESRREGVPFTVKILDFGIAKLVAERTAEGTQPVGTPLFMAPEQTDRRGHIGPATDVWPLGVMCFYLLTGKHYWLAAEAGITSLLREVVMDPLVAASQRAHQLGVGDKLPPGFDTWFAGCVNRDPRQRYPDGGACVRAFLELARSVITGVGSTLAQPPVIHGGTTGDAITVPDPTATGPAAMSQAHATGATVMATGAGGSTGLTAASSMDTSPQKKSMAGFVVGGLVVLGGVGAAAYFATRDGGETDVAAPTTTATSSASAAAASQAPTCPEGMILHESGNMFMGSVDEDLADDVRPPHKVKLSSYCLDEKEVTVAAFRSCVKSGNCLRTKNMNEVAFPGATPKMVEELSKLCNYGADGKDDHPMNCIDHKSAQAFCETEGGRVADGGARLPTEAEWEFAARGSGQRVFPWGDEAPGPERLNACGSECAAWEESVGLTSYGTMYETDDGHAATAPVGSFPKGASSNGVLDLAGNVWEWTADWYGPYAEDEQSDPKGPEEGTDRVVRGGGFNGLKPSWAKPAYRFKIDPESRSHGIGFRCAADVAGG